MPDRTYLPGLQRRPVIGDVYAINGPVTIYVEPHRTGGVDLRFVADDAVSIEHRHVDVSVTADAPAPLPRIATMTADERRAMRARENKVMGSKIDQSAGAKEEIERRIAAVAGTNDPAKE